MNAESNHPERNPVTIRKVYPDGKTPFVEVTIEVDAKSPQGVARALINAVELQSTETPKGAAQVFNRLIRGASAVQRGLDKRYRKLDPANARHIRGGHKP